MLVKTTASVIRYGNAMDCNIAAMENLDPGSCSKNGENCNPKKRYTRIPIRKPKSQNNARNKGPLLRWNNVPRLNFNSIKKSPLG